MIAMITIAMPATNDVPSWPRLRPSRTGWPSPGPSMNAAIVAIDSAAIIVWLIPTMMVRLASGSSTLARRWRRLWPMDAVASITPTGRVRMPCAVIRTTGGRRVDQGDDDRRRGTDAEEDADRQQVDERRHRLHEVEHRGDDRGHHLAVPHPEAERDADRGRDPDGDPRDQQQVDGVGPVAEEAEGQERGDDEQQAAPARDGEGDQRGERDGADPADLRQRPRELRHGEDVLEPLEDGVDPRRRRS